MGFSQIFTGTPSDWNRHDNECPVRVTNTVVITE